MKVNCDLTGSLVCEAEVPQYLFGAGLVTCVSRSTVHTSSCSLYRAEKTQEMSE